MSNTTVASALEYLWAARSIAIVGASNRDNALGSLPITYLQRYGYAGSIFPINPSTTEVRGLPCYPSLGAVHSPIDLALVMVSAAHVPQTIDECAAARIPMVIVGASGFAEAGTEGTALQADMAARAKAAGIRLLGPNCIGAVGFATKLMATFTPLFSASEVPWHSGSVGFVSQSGALGFGAVSLALERGLGLGWAINTGNEADVTALEVLETLGGLDSCDALLAYVEQLSDADALRRLASLGKPIALIKAGGSDAGAAAAASHTGALATPDRVVNAALRQLGIARALDVDELLDFGEAFSQPRRPAGPRVAIVSTSGGSGILATDAIDASGLSLASLTNSTRSVLDEFVPAFGSTANPVDVTATVMSDISVFERCLDAVAADPGVDTIIACFCVLVDDDVDAIVAALGDVAARTGKPVLVARTGGDFLAPLARDALRRTGIPSYTTPTRAVRAADALWAVSSGRQASSVPRSGTISPPRKEDEHSLKVLLAAAGLPVAEGRLVRSGSDAEKAVIDLGGCAVGKAVVPGLLHKTEAGGVALGITPSLAPGVYKRLKQLGGEVRFEEQVSDHTEVLVGVASTPLGPVVSVGTGGIHTEALDDIAVRLAPIDVEEAESMLAETAVGRILTDGRAQPAGDVRSLCRLISRVSHIVMGWPTRFELDLNPVAVTATGVRILDAAYVNPMKAQ